MQGYSLIELLVVIVIATILLLLGAASFSHLVSENRAVATVNNIVAGLQFARSEAITCGGEVKYCASENGKSCGQDWSKGQIVMDKSGKVLRIFSALVDGDHLSWNQKQKYVLFTNLGGTKGQSGTFTYCPAWDKKAARAVIVYYSGRVRVSERLANGGKIKC